MESHLKSRKRKHHQSKESDVIFTRSKSQIYVHRHRFGHARPDRNGGRVESVGSEGKVLPKEVKLDGRVDRVKDLRARRVFSPASISNHDEDEDGFDDVIKGAGIGSADVIKEGGEVVDIDGGDVNLNDGVKVVSGDVSKVVEIVSDDVINGVKVVIGDVIKEGEEVDGDVNVNGGDVSKGGENVRGDVIKADATVIDDVSKEGGVVEIDVCKKIDDDVIKGGETVRGDVIKGGEVDVNDVIKGGETGDADVIKGDAELKNGDVVSVAAKEVGGMNKSQSKVTSLRGRRKVFKSPSTFSYRRLLPYLQEIDSSKFEIVDAKLPEKNLKLGDNASNMVAHGDQEISAVSVGNLTDETSKSASEEQYSNKVNPEVSRNVESSDVVQKSHDDVLNDTFEECEQMAPPDNEFDDVYKKSGDDVINGGEVVSVDVIKGDEVVEIDVCKKIDGGDVKVNDDGVIKGDEISKDDEVVIGDFINEGELGGDDVIKVGEVVECDKNEGDAVKSQSLVTSLRGRRKVFKSPSSFSYRRLLSYLQDTDSSNFEIVDAKLPEKKLKLGDHAPNMVAHGEQEITAVSVGINLTDESSKSASEEQYLNKVNPEVSRNVESSDMVQKSYDDVLNDTLEECEQMTPPDADIYSKPQTDKMLDVVVKPKPKPVLTPCSRMNLLQTPTSYTHRRLLPFLMSVAEDGILKGNQSLKVVKGREQSQQPPTLPLSHQNLGIDEPKIISNPEQDATNEKSDSPTSTLIPADTSVDRKRIVILVSSDNLLDTHGSDMECSGSATQLEVNSQSEAVEFDNSIKLELSPLKDNLKLVEEATVKVIETVPDICTEQITDADNDFTGIKSSCSEGNQELVNESAHQTLQITPLMTPSINGENFRNGILKRTPRGCRGICNCLNCTSFRLHAERSFEFSRNQMHDAEEVALDLINDLTSLRKLLETTASDSNSLGTDKEKQIKEACEKALYKEEVAKARLSQMNEDLSFHCRSMKLMRPKVTFANKIEEKLISKDVCGKKSV